MPEIKERIDELSPIKNKELGVIVAHADPDTGCISINIDADIVTLGVVAKLLAHRYNVNLNEFIKKSLVPPDTDTRVHAIVNDYLMRGRDRITIVRKDINNG